MIKVVCGLIFRDGRILICRRASNKSLAGYWEFPGGKIEPNESMEDCIRRELFEELNMTVEVDSYFMTVRHSYDTFDIELMAYICEFKLSSFTMTDHDRFEWVEIKDLVNWRLAPADIPIAEELANSHC